MKTVKARFTYMEKTYELTLADRKAYIDGCELTEKRISAFTEKDVWVFR